jgi:sarcosine oxidase subunit gamma
VHDLTPLTALGGTRPRVDAVANVTLTENPDLALASVTARIGQEVACAGRLADLLGAEPPGPGKARLSDPYSAFWMGPDQWMLCAPFSSHEDLAAQVKAHCAGTASITEQTDGWACFDLLGPQIGSVMELLCALDMRAMTSGDASRTVIHHLGCFVIRQAPGHGAGDGIRILGPRASAGSLHHAILTAMTSAL